MVFGILATCILDNTFKSYENVIFLQPLDLRILWPHNLYTKQRQPFLKYSFHLHKYPTKVFRESPPRVQKSENPSKSVSQWVWKLISKFSQLVFRFSSDRAKRRAICCVWESKTPQGRTKTEILHNDWATTSKTSEFGTSSQWFYRPNAEGRTAPRTHSERATVSIVRSRQDTER